MRWNAIVVLLALTLLPACASSLQVRDFRADYERTKSRSYVRVPGHPPFRVLELREQRRIQVHLNVLAQAFGGLADPLVLLGVSDGIPSLSAHQQAAQAYLIESGRSGCSVEPLAVAPGGREFEFRYSCPGGA
jgi:hypothetical protein